MNETIRNTILDELTTAFPAKPIRLELEAGPYDAWSSYDDRDAFEHGIAGKTWRELSDDFIKAHPDALIFLPSEWFAMLLPAYLWFVVLDDVYNEVPFAVANMLTRTDDSVFDKNISSLTRAQLDVIAKVVEASLHREPMEDVMQAAHESYWRH